MTINVSLDKVISPRSISAIVNDTNNIKTLMQIYTGEIAFDYNISDNHIHNDTIRSYIPYEDGSIQPYTLSKDIIPTFTVIGSLTGDYDATDPHLAAVGKVSVRLESQSFTGIGGPQQVIVLRANVSAMNGSAQALAYQVTLLTRETTLGKVLILAGGNRTPH